MADTSKLRYDDFVSNVQPDPAKPESTIMLSGFVGHGPEGHARIYPDPTLGTWYDVPEGDVIHSAPIADSKLGGSYVWVRAAAEIKPGSAAPTTTEAVQPHAAAGINPTPATHCFVCDAPKAAMALQPTPTAQTHCFICPPHQTPQCTLPTVCCTQLLGCHTTPGTLCFICPPHTQVFNCPTQPLVCNFQHTQPVVCGIVPPSIGCQQGAAQPQPEAVMAAAVPPKTAATICTMPPGCLQQPTPATHCFICPPHQTPHCTLPTVCTMPPACPPPPTPATHCFICPPHQTPHCTLPTVCTMPPACPPPPPTPATLCLICPPHQPPHSLPTMCPMPPACPIGPLGGPTFITLEQACLTLLTCPQTLQPGCQQGGAQQQAGAAANAAWTMLATRCICNPQPAQQHQEAAAPAPPHPNTAATVCTMPPACGVTAVNTLCCLLTQPAICLPGGGFTLNATQCICLTPGNTLLLCPPVTATVAPATLWCTLVTCPQICLPLPNGVFTPFGR
jgi:hypothetical protein